MTDVRMATARQTFALFCITKKDYRKEAPMTYQEASDLINKLNADKGYTAKAVGEKMVVMTNKAKEIHMAAVTAGAEALASCTPTPMVVEQRENVMDDKSPVEKQWFVEGGPCGFAWVHFKATTKENREFLAGLKKAGLVTDNIWHKDTYRGGYSYNVFQGGQSIQRKEAFGGAFAQVLRDNGITAYMMSRMD
jgi:hypothetical protein